MSYHMEIDLNIRLKNTEDGEIVTLIKMRDEDIDVDQHVENQKCMEVDIMDRIDNGEGRGRGKGR